VVVVGFELIIVVRNQDCIPNKGMTASDTASDNAECSNSSVMCCTYDDITKMHYAGAVFYSPSRA